MNAADLKYWRKKKKMTQRELADFLGVSKRTVVAWENEQNNVPHWVAGKLQGEGLRLNPKLSYEVLMAAKQKADEKGQSFDEWVADLITKSLLIGLAWLAFHFL